MTNIGPNHVTPSDEHVFATRHPRTHIAANCDYCGSRERETIFEEMRDEDRETLPPAFQDITFCLVKCKQCGLTYLAERPHTKDLDIYYPDNYMCFQDYGDRGRLMKWLANRVARSKWRQIQRLMPEGSNHLLDYGCGSGTWLKQLQSLGCDYTLTGTDVVPGPLRSLPAAGINAHCCDDQTLFDHIEPQSIGVVHLFHVIEHVPSPKMLLEKLKDALVPGGAILGQTPNIASMGCRFWGQAWNQWHVPRHFVLFTHETLKRHAEEAGLEVVALKSSLSGATQWAHGVCKWRAQRKGRAFRSIGESWYPYLIFAFLPWTVLESLFSHTCHMDFVFRRPKS